MKTLALAPGRVGPLASYLKYLFLRFPGTLDEEVSLNFACYDTYDRRWSRQGKIWVERETELELVVPPSLTRVDESVSAFGLQAPVRVGRVSLRARAVSFVLGPGAQASGHILSSSRGHQLVLRGPEGLAFDALEAALVTDGLIPVSPAEGWWVEDEGTPFEGPRAIPGPPLTSPAAPFLLAHLREGLRVARQYEAGIRDDVDTECLHQYRVHLRRVRSLASLGHLWQVVPEWTRLKNVLRELQQRTNELRDLDVLILDLPGLREGLPWGEGSRLDGWEASIRRRRHTQWKAVQTWLGSPEHAHLQDELERLWDDLGRYGEPWTVGDLAASAFDRSRCGLEKALKAVRAESPDEQLHEVRIRTKRLRYVLDSLGFLGPAGPVKALTVLLKQSQEGLGAFQDRAILLDRLKDELVILRNDDEATDLLAFGVLVGTLAGEHTARKRAAYRDAKRLKSGVFRKALRQLSPRSEVADGP